MKYYLREIIYSIIKFNFKYAFSFTYRNIISSGYEKVSKNKPAIFVANHQNTFMDGVLMVYTAGSSNPNILVRADIFKSGLAKKALGLIKLMPIYRKRDGLNNLSQNEQIFNQCFEIFTKKGVVALFPEGNHAFPRRLRPLQKGAARIAFQAEEVNNFNLNLSMIPVSLQYENHTERWHDVYVHYKDAFEVKNYRADLKENPQKTYKTVTDKIQSGISSQMIDIKWEDAIDFFEDIRILMKETNKRKDQDGLSLVHLENQMIKELTSYYQNKEEEKNKLEQKLDSFIRSLRKAGINTYYSLKERSLFYLSLKALLLLVFAPFFIVFKAISAIPELIIEKGVISGVKDKTWHLSLRFAISSFLYPIFFGLIWIILAFMMDNILAAIIVFSFPIISIIGLEWMHHLKGLKNEWVLFRKKHLVKDMKTLVGEVKQIMA